MSIKKTHNYLFKLKLRSKKQYCICTYNPPNPMCYFTHIPHPPHLSHALSHTLYAHTYTTYIHTQEICKLRSKKQYYIPNPPNPVLFQPTPLTPRSTPVQSTPSTFYTLHNNNIPLSTNTCSPKWTPTYIQLA